MNPVLGVKVIVLFSFTTAVPWSAIGAELIATVMGSSSRPRSLKRTSISTAVLKLVPRRSSLATGTEFGFSVTVTVTVATSKSPSISETV